MQWKVFIVLVGLSLLPTSTLSSRPCTYCLENFSMVNGMMWRDAQCCDPDNPWDCLNYTLQGYDIMERWTGCGVEMIQNGYRCNGDSDCDSYWGPGGDTCVIEAGGFCPAECQRCTMQV